MKPVIRWLVQVWTCSMHYQERYLEMWKHTRHSIHRKVLLLRPLLLHNSFPHPTPLSAGQSGLYEAHGDLFWTEHENLTIMKLWIILEQIWNDYGTIMKVLWKDYGTFMKHLWNNSGTSVERLWSHTVWKDYGMILERMWNSYEMIIEQSWNSIRMRHTLTLVWTNGEIS